MSSQEPAIAVPHMNAEFYSLFANTLRQQHGRFKAYSEETLTGIVRDCLNVFKSRPCIGPDGQIYDSEALNKHIENQTASGKIQNIKSEITQKQYPVSLWKKAIQNQNDTLIVAFLYIKFMEELFPQIQAQHKHELGTAKEDNELLEGLFRAQQTLLKETMDESEKTKNDLSKVLQLSEFLLLKNREYINLNKKLEDEKTSANLTKEKFKETLNDSMKMLNSMQLENRKLTALNEKWQKENAKLKEQLKTLEKKLPPTPTLGSSFPFLAPPSIHTSKENTTERESQGVTNRHK